ncbi:AAA family ATPase [Sphingobacterium sp.]|uniref:AAA family ATPase n=1 Tax=Sphingobacterium sp. TaxID=341027 RepID=UPI0031CF4012
MIIGLFLRNFKTYSGINYIPLTYGPNFCGLVGNNGIGKSSVLEALDCFFNRKSWNFNVVTKKSGLATTRPHIVPVFAISIKEISKENLDLAKELSDYVWELEEADIIGQNRPHFKMFQDQLQLIKRDKSKEDTLLLPLGLTYDDMPSLSIFNNRKLGTYLMGDSFDKTAQLISDVDIQLYEGLIAELITSVEYIYIPKDIDPDNFTQLETKEIQSLMGETLIDIVQQCVPQKKIQEINTNLNTFIDGLSTILKEYSFRTVSERQVNVRKSDVYKLIIEAYFKIRKLHRREGDHWLEMASLSSGEKQKAIIELAYQFLKNHRANASRVILGIDEPEASLHMSACYEQFSKLFEISKLCNQLFFTTHWYGFLPTIGNGSVSIITKTKDEHQFDLINVNSYREAIKQSAKESKGLLPFDIRLKSINDFIQSIITSIITEEPYNWLICEGSSEKIYFEKYLEDIVRDKKLRIIPVGGASEIKRIYNNLQVAYEDFKTEVKGKVVLLSDTDEELVQFPVRKDLRNLKCWRMVNITGERKTKLVAIDSNPVSPKTEIEDALNGKLFFNVLKTFESSYPIISEAISGLNNPSEDASYFSLDLSPSKAKLLETFFDMDNNKFAFATVYSSMISDEYKTPDWIEEIRNIY